MRMFVALILMFAGCRVQPQAENASRAQGYFDAEDRSMVVYVDDPTGSAAEGWWLSVRDVKESVVLAAANFCLGTGDECLKPEAKAVKGKVFDAVTPVGTVFVSSERLKLADGKPLSVWLTRKGSENSVELSTWTVKISDGKVTLIGVKIGERREAPPPSTDPLVPNPRNVPLHKLEFEAIRLTNAYRQQQGWAPLRVSGTLVAWCRAQAAANARDNAPNRHTEPSSRGINFSWAENAFHMYNDPKAIVNGWMASPDHHQNIFRFPAGSIGIGVAWTPSGYPHWIQQFSGQWIE